jgi:hypothetical protein
MKKDYLNSKGIYFKIALLGLFCFLVAFAPKDKENPKKKKPITITAKAFDPNSFLPLTVNGYNADVIANGLGALNTTTTNDVDGVNYCYLSVGTQTSGTATPTTYGLPTNGLIDVPNSSLFFQLASYSANNSLRINQNGVAGQATVTFTELSSFEKIHLAVTSGSGASDVSFTVNFSDATTQVISSATIPDWFNSTALPVAISGIGRGNTTNNVLENPAGNPRIYQLDLNIDPANQSKIVTGITIQKITGGVFNLFAATGKLVPECPNPTNIVATTINSTDATVTWSSANTSDTFEVAVVNTGNPIPATGTVSATNTYTFLNLTPITTYDVYVRTICPTTGFSFWSGPYTFTTTCAAVTDFVQNFDSSPTGVGNLPPCWSRTGTSANVYTTTGGAAPMSAPNRLFMSITTTTTAYAILPPVSNLQANSHRLRFKAYASAASKILSVGYFTTPGDASTYVELEPLQMPSTALANTENFTVIPTGIPAGVTQLVFTTPAGVATTIYIDDVKWEYNSSCVEPSALNATSFTSNGATLGWTAGGGETTWDIEYGLTGFVLGTGTVVTGISSNSHVLNTLLADTSYQFYVRGVCAGPENSSWSGPFAFRTLCAEVTEFIQNFDSSPTGTGNLPTCWSRAGTSANVYTTTASAAPMSAPNRLYMNISATTNAYAILPPVSNLQANTHRLRFKGYATATGKLLSVGYFTTPGDLSSFIEIEPLQMPSTALASTQEFFIIPSGVPAGVNQLVFYITGSATTIYIDDVAWEAIPTTVPSCASNIVATPNATCGNFATSFAWDPTVSAEGYRITMGTTAGGNDILNNVDLGNVTSYSYTGNFNTTYYYTLTPYNVIGNAVSCTEQSFTTFVTGCYCTSLPTSNDGAGITNVLLASTNFPTTDVTYFDHTATAVTLPQGVSTNLLISFATGYTYNTYVWIDFNDNLTFETSEIVFTGESLATNPTIYNASFVMPVTATLGTHRMRIVTADALTTANPCYSGTYGVTLDFNVTITPAPTCIPPAALTATSITNAAANLGWTENGTATVWDIEWGTNGFTPTGTPNIAGTTTNPHNLTGLSANTAYSFYVRANCGGANGESTWSGPFNFTTLCDPYTIPYFEGFESGYTHNTAVAGCLSQSSVTGTQVWTANNTLTDYNRSPRTGSWNAFLRYGNEDWLYIPVQLVGGTNYTVELYARQDGATAANSNMSISYGSSAAEAAMTNAIVPATGIVNGGYQQITGTFTPATTGVYYVGIKGFMNGTPWYISLDDIRIDVTPSCVAPTAVNVTATTQNSLAFAWSASPTETGGYEWRVMNNGGDVNVDTPAASGSVATGVTNALATGLVIDTTYQIYVRALCGTSDTSAWSTPLTALVGYCVPTGTSNATYVSDFSTTLGATNITNAASGFSTGNYGNFTTQSTSVGSTQSFDFNIAVVGGTLGCAIWVDWNNNLVFDAAEMVFSTTSYGSGPYTGTITVPAATANGNYRMRVLVDFNDSNPGDDDACSLAFGRGEVEDYTITVDNALSTDNFDNASFTAYPNPVNDVLNLSYSSEISSVKVINLLGQEVISRNVGTNSTQIDMTNLNAGAYIVNVTIGEIVKSIKVIKQ